MTLHSAWPLINHWQRQYVNMWGFELWQSRIKSTLCRLSYPPSWSHVLPHISRHERKNTGAILELRRNSLTRHILFCARHAVGIRYVAYKISHVKYHANVTWTFGIRRILGPSSFDDGPSMRRMEHTQERYWCWHPPHFCTNELMEDTECTATMYNHVVQCLSIAYRSPIETWQKSRRILWHSSMLGHHDQLL